VRYLIVSDIHGNLEAFQAVLKAVPQFDAIWCLGDIVGYGPNPNECVDLLRKFPHVAVPGNHDYVATGQRSDRDFNVHAQQAARWTAKQIQPDVRNYLNALPPTVQQGDFFLAHGSPRRPIDEYIMRTTEARDNFPHFPTRYCLVGHTHIASIFIAHSEDAELKVTSQLLSPEKPIVLGEERMIINVGSVDDHGQPRDHNPDAACGTYNSETRTFTLFRVPYDVGTTQEKMRQAGLPEYLVERLALGM